MNSFEHKQPQNFTKDNDIHKTISWLIRVLDNINFESACLRIYNSENLLSLTINKSGHEVCRLSLDLHHLESNTPNYLSFFVPSFIETIKEKYGKDSIESKLQKDSTQHCTIYNIRKQLK